MKNVYMMTKKKVYIKRSSLQHNSLSCIYNQPCLLIDLIIALFCKQFSILIDLIITLCHKPFNILIDLIITLCRKPFNIKTVLVLCVPIFF